MARTIEGPDRNRAAPGPDRWIALVLFLAAFLVAAAGVRRYGLTWDEPTYLHFARMQSAWCGDLLGASFHPGRLSALLSQRTIAEVWLQHPEANGHPPLNELWMGLAGAPFRLFDAPEILADRASICLLLAATAALLYLLLRRGASRAASLAGALALLGVPCVWAHGHIGATETMQNAFWVLLALLLPPALERGGRWPAVWLLASALSFMAKFTNVLIPVWVLGTAGLLGAWKRPRYWLCAALALGLGPLLLLLFDPFFWPWQGGVPRFLDYLRQATTRGQWVPIDVYYLGRTWDFRPPWHYRLVMTLASVPVPVLLLALPGIAFAGTATWRALRTRARSSDLRDVVKPGGVWPRALGLTGLVFALLVGILPNSPNHDGTRQFVYVFVAVALLAGAGADGILEWIRRRWGEAHPERMRYARGGVVILALAGAGVSIAHEPWGLSYYSEWIGGERGAWKRGLELTYWSETITPRLVAEAARIPARDGKEVRVHAIPKLNYFADAEEVIRPLLPAEARNLLHLPKDDFSAYFSEWARPMRAGPRAGILGLSFRSPPDAIVISYRRATVAPGLWGFLDALSRRGEIDLLDEVRVGGVPLARLYRVKELVEARLPEDPEGRTWWQLPSVAAASRRGE